MPGTLRSSKRSTHSLTCLQRAADAANGEMSARLDQLLEAARVHREQSKVEWDRSQEQVSLLLGATQHNTTQRC
jgi:hypothetical protein